MRIECTVGRLRVRFDETMLALSKRGLATTGKRAGHAEAPMRLVIINDDSMMHQTFKAGARALFIKPFSGRALASTADRAMRSDAVAAP